MLCSFSAQLFQHWDKRGVMPEHLFYFLFCASEAQILKSTLGANAAPIDNLAVPGDTQTSFSNTKELWRGNTHGSSWTQLWLQESILWIQSPCTYKMNMLSKIKGLPAQPGNSSTTMFFMAFSSSASHCTWNYYSIWKLITNQSFHQLKQNSRMRNKNLGQSHWG